MARDRAASEVIGFVLVFSLVASTVAIVSVSGLNSLEATRNSEQLNNAERAFDVLADNMADIHSNGAPSRATEISLESATLRGGSEVSINVTGTRSGETNPNITYNYSPIVYEAIDSETQLVYSGGAVFREQREGGVVVKDPPYLLGSDRVYVPIIQTNERADGRVVGGQTVRVRGELALKKPIPRHTKPRAQYDRLIINVTSPRSDLWERYFLDNEMTCASNTRENNTRCWVDDPDRVYVTQTTINYEFET